MSPINGSRSGNRGQAHPAPVGPARAERGEPEATCRSYGAGSLFGPRAYKRPAPKGAIPARPPYNEILLMQYAG